MKSLKVYNLRCNALKNPMGISITEPRLTWKIASENRETVQKSFCISVRNNNTEIFNSGKIESDDNFYILRDLHLQSRKKYEWTVEVLDNHEETAMSGEYACFEMGLLKKTDWKARWIEPEQHPVFREEHDMYEMMPGLREQMFENNTRRRVPDEAGGEKAVENGDVQDMTIHEERLFPCPMIRKKFKVNKEIRKARIYATAHGLYQMELNGKKVGDYVMAPEASSYEKYLQVQTYDITDDLLEGDNALGITLADGWWAGRLGSSGESARFGDMLGLLLQIELEYTDHERKIIGSDQSFVSTTNGPRRYADLLIGEKYDASMELPHWSEVDFDDSEWTNVHVKEYSLDNLTGQNAQHMKVIETIDHVKSYISPKGELMLDCGQDMSGTMTMDLKGEPNAVVTLKYCEEPDKDGNFQYEITGENSIMIDTVVLNDKGEGHYDPWFTYHGYRYVAVYTDCGEIEVSNVKARLTASDIPVTLKLETSNKKLNKLQENIKWTLRSNIISILTDNPDRERSGWTGDTQMIAPTLCFNLDVEAMLDRWLNYCRLEQGKNGEIPAVIPYWDNWNTDMNHSSAGWGDVVVLLPWFLYQKYGDIRILEENYPMMEKWIALEKYRAESANPSNIGEITEERQKYLKYIWNADWNFGDWLTPSACLDENGNVVIGAQVLCYLMGTYYYVYSISVMEKIAGVLRKHQDEKQYKELKEKIREAAIHELYNRGQIYESEYMGAQILAYHMGLYPEQDKDKLFARIIEQINEKGNDTGFSSALVLPKILCENGESERMYDFLLDERSPSWLYEVNQGATTVWESMLAITPDGKRAACSFIQPAYCSIGNFMVEYMGGISAAEAGFKKIRIHPYVTERLEYSDVSYESVRGPIRCRWERTETKICLDVEIPANTEAEIIFPLAKKENITESGMILALGNGIRSIKESAEGVTVCCGSGCYSYQYLSL